MVLATSSRQGRATRVPRRESEAKGRWVLLMPTIPSADTWRPERRARASDDAGQRHSECAKAKRRPRTVIRA